MTHPITQRDVAIACGLHPSTVCLALKHAPSIPAATRRRIQAIAEKLGYQPNVAARNLALMRTERAPAGGGSLPIAWINQEPRRDHWRSDPEARSYLEGAQQRAAEAGYHLEEFWTQEPGMHVARLVQILRARGIEGVIFPAHRSFDFSLLHQGWHDFAMVGMNDHRLGEWLDVVCPDYHRNMDVVLRHLRRLGFERIGLVLTAQFDAATSGLAHGCFLRHQAELAPEERVPVCVVAGGARDGAAAVAAWREEHRPDVIIGREEWPGRPEAAPRGAAVRVQLHGAIDGCEAGMEPGAAEIAAAAVDCVAEKIRRFEKGVRESTRVHLIKGSWHERRIGVREREVQTVVA